MGDDGAPDHPVFDADNHYYEAVDAFTRHLDPALGARVIQWCEVDGRRYHVIGGRVSHAVTNPTFGTRSSSWPRGSPSALPTANRRPGQPPSTSRDLPDACSSPLWG